MRKLTYKIIKESFRIVILTSIISTIGGIGLESIQEKLFTILPLIILVPALNNLTGSFGAVTSSRFTSMLYMTGIKKDIWKNKEIRKMFFLTIFLSFILSIYVSLISIFSANLLNFDFDFFLATRIVALSVLTSLTLSMLIFFVVIKVGIRVYKRKQDPDNFLIPLTTAIADFGTMSMMTLFVFILF